MGAAIQLLSSRANQERAIAVGIMLECYENEPPDDGLVACLTWAKAEFDNIDDQEEIAHKKLAETLKVP